MNRLWHGFFIEEAEFERKKTITVFPKEGTAIGRLAIKTEYWDAFPEAIEIELLKEGFHLCYIENENRWGTDEDIDRKVRFIQAVTKRFGLQKRVVSIGMSCGGLIAIKMAAKYPEMFSCLYLDAPVLNYLSCPCGLGDANPLDNGSGIMEVLNALNLENILQLAGYRQMPLDWLPKLVAARIPVALIAGGKDMVVPYHENGLFLQRAYEEADIDFTCYIKPECGHHPHGIKDNGEMLSFILMH